MEYLDIYDENGNYLGKEDRKIVHQKALWHKTVHCWLYDKMGNIYFQRRKDEGTLYTTASGHILAGETVKEGFGREIKEEIGIDIDYEKAELVRVIPFVLDKKKEDGTFFRDRAFANVYIFMYEGSDEFPYDEKEITGLVKVNAKETLLLFENATGKIKGTFIEKNHIQEQDVFFEDFLVNKGETAIEKYGEVLKKVISMTKNLG